MKRTLLCLLVAFGCLSAAERHSLTPVGAPASFEADPGVKHTFCFTTEALPDGGEYDWQLTGFAGEETGRSGKASVKSRRLEVELTLPAGFYELRFPDLGQVFGVSVLPAFKGEVDSFFAIEALLETRSADVQKNCLDLLLRHGIRHNRDWTNFGKLNPAEGRYDVGFDRFYHEAGAKGVRSIFTFNDFPEWMGGIPVRRGNLSKPGRRTVPGNLPQFNAALARMLESRKVGLEGVQPLNEYDNAAIPAEASLPALKTAAWAARGRDLALIGAAFSQSPTVSERDSIAGGMLDFIDAFAFHTYAAPERIVSLTAEFRDSMANDPKGRLPLWITETGKPWKRGLKVALKNAHSGPLDNLHPQSGEDMISALWITMKAVESKACGIARYFPFVMQFFQENDDNFGMLDYYGTPLRSMNAYAFVADLLANREYRGDWKANPAGLQPTRVFADRDSAVAVFYAGKEGTASRTVSLAGFPEGRGYGIDGSELRPEKGALKFLGGMAYWVFPAAKLDSALLNVDTEAMRLLKAAKSYQPVPRRSTPLVYRYDFLQDPDGWNNVAGYRFPEGGKFHFIVANLSDEKRVTRPAVALPEGVRLAQPLPESLELAPRSETKFAVVLANQGGSRFSFRIGDAADPLSATRLPVIDYTRLTSETRDFMNPKRWHQNSSGKQSFRFDEAEQAIVVVTDFANKAQGKWSFPEFRFRPEEKKGNLLAVSFDFRLEDSKTPVLYSLLMLSFTGKPYESYQLASQAEWKHYLIPVDGKAQPYDLLRIGLGTTADKIAFRFRNIKLWY